MIGGFKKLSLFLSTDSGRDSGSPTNPKSQVSPFAEIHRLPESAPPAERHRCLKDCARLARGLRLNTEDCRILSDVVERIILRDGEEPLELHLAALDALCALIEGQERFGFLVSKKLKYFHLVRSIKSDHRDLSLRVRLLRLLTGNGTCVHEFGRDLGLMLLTWLSGGENVETCTAISESGLISLLENICKYGASVLDEDIIISLLIEVSLICYHAEKLGTINQCLSLFYAVGSFPQQALSSLLIALCMTVNVAADKSWNIMQVILHANGYIGVTGILSIMENPGESPEIIRGAVYFISMATWGSRSISTLHVPYMAVLPSLRAALDCNNEVVAYEVVLSLHRLVKKYGESLHQEWDVIMDMLLALRFFPAKATNLPECLRNTVMLVENLYRHTKFGGDRDQLLRLLEGFRQTLPLHSSLLVLDLREEQVKSCQPGWLNFLSDFMETFFRDETRLKVRENALRVLSSTYDDVFLVDEDSISDRIIFPYLADVHLDRNPTIRIKGVQLLGHLACKCNFRHFKRIIGLLDQVMGLPSDPGHVKVCRVSATMLVQVLLERFADSDPHFPLFVYDVLLKHANTDEIICRQMIQSCIMKLRATQNFHAKLETTVSPHLSVVLSNGEKHPAVATLKVPQLFHSLVAALEHESSRELLIASCDDVCDMLLNYYFVASIDLNPLVSTICKHVLIGDSARENDSLPDLDKDVSAGTTPCKPPAVHVLHKPHPPADIFLMALRTVALTVSYKNRLHEELHSQIVLCLSSGVKRGLSMLCCKCGKVEGNVRNQDAAVLGPTDVKLTEEAQTRVDVNGYASEDVVFIEKTSLAALTLCLFEMPEAVAKNATFVLESLSLLLKYPTQMALALALPVLEFLHAFAMNSQVCKALCASSRDLVLSYLLFYISPQQSDVHARHLAYSILPLWVMRFPHVYRQSKVHDILVVLAAQRCELATAAADMVLRLAFEDVKAPSVQWFRPNFDFWGAPGGVNDRCSWVGGAFLGPTTAAGPIFENAVSRTWVFGSNCLLTIRSGLLGFSEVIVRRPTGTTRFTLQLQNLMHADEVRPEDIARLVAPALPLVYPPIESPSVSTSPTVELRKIPPRDHGADEGKAVDVIADQDVVSAECLAADTSVLTNESESDVLPISENGGPVETCSSDPLDIEALPKGHSSPKLSDVIHPATLGLKRVESDGAFSRASGKTGSTLSLASIASETDRDSKESHEGGFFHFSGVDGLEEGRGSVGKEETSGFLQLPASPSRAARTVGGKREWGSPQFWYPGSYRCSAPDLHLEMVDSDSESDENPGSNALHMAFAQSSWPKTTVQSQEASGAKVDDTEDGRTAVPESTSADEKACASDDDRARSTEAPEAPAPEAPRTPVEGSDEDVFVYCNPSRFLAEMKEGKQGSPMFSSLQPLPSYDELPPQSDKGSPQSQGNQRTNINASVISPTTSPVVESDASASSTSVLQSLNAPLNGPLEQHPACEPLPADILGAAARPIHGRRRSRSAFSSSSMISSRLEYHSRSVDFRDLEEHTRRRSISSFLRNSMEDGEMPGNVEGRSYHRFSRCESKSNMVQRSRESLQPLLCSSSLYSSTVPRSPLETPVQPIDHPTKLSLYEDAITGDAHVSSPMRKDLVRGDHDRDVDYGAMHKVSSRANVGLAKEWDSSSSSSSSRSSSCSSSSSKSNRRRTCANSGSCSNSNISSSSSRSSCSSSPSSDNHNELRANLVTSSQHCATEGTSPSSSDRPEIRGSGGSPLDERNSGIERKPRTTSHALKDAIGASKADHAGGQQEPCKSQDSYGSASGDSARNLKPPTGLVVGRSSSVRDNTGAPAPTTSEGTSSLLREALNDHKSSETRLEDTIKTAEPTAAKQGPRPSNDASTTAGRDRHVESGAPHKAIATGVQTDAPFEQSGLKEASNTASTSESTKEPPSGFSVSTPACETSNTATSSEPSFAKTRSVSGVSSTGSTPVAATKPSSSSTGFRKILGEDKAPLNTATNVAKERVSRLHPAYSFVELFPPLGQQRPQVLKSDETLDISLKALDTTPCVQTHKIGIVYVGEGQRTAEEALRNTHGSGRYIRFLQSLGDFVKLRNYPGYTGGLDTYTDADGPYAIMWSDLRMCIVYHVATLMPAKAGDPESRMKVRHLGNDFVNIIFVESALDADAFDLNSMSGEFNAVHLLVFPVDDETFRLEIKLRHDLPPVGPVIHPSLVSAAALPAILRLAAIHNNLASMLTQHKTSYQSNWEERLRAIKRISERNLDPQALESSVFGLNI
eukprot:Rmarinus@m.3964